MTATDPDTNPKERAVRRELFALLLLLLGVSAVIVGTWNITPWLTLCCAGAAAALSGVLLAREKE